jgi:hypothetical protein
VTSINASQMARNARHLCNSGAIGFIILLFVWVNFDGTTMIMGFSWLAVGVVIAIVNAKRGKTIEFNAG